jgi:tRNA-modifying protein YgfZ
MTISAETLAQYSALTSGVGVADLAGRTLIAVTGADRAQLLHSFTTSDVKKLPVGGNCEAFVTSPQGKTLGHVLIANRGDRFTLDTTGGQAGTLIAHFQRYIITEDAELRDLTAERGELLVAGPRAPALLQQLAAVGNEPAMSDVQIAGAKAIVKRVSYVAAPNFFIEAARGDLPVIRAALEAAGALACGAEAVEMARIEAGTPLFGQDITDDNLPQEIGRDALAISFTKGCYLGQETVARIDALGHVNRQLAGVKFAGSNIPSRGLELVAGDKPAGAVTSAAWSPKLQAPLAMALLRRGQAKAAAALNSQLGDAVVVALPV